MKKIVTSLLAGALLFALAGCGGPAADSSAPPADPPASSTSGPAQDTPAPPVTLEPVSPAEPDDARYFFAEGAFLGSWDNGTWHSAADGGFTLGQLLNRDYISWLGDKAGSVRFNAGPGPGGLVDADWAQPLLKPFGVLEGDDFIMHLPGQLTGEAAEIPVPDYGFYAQFDGQMHYLISNAPIKPADLNTNAQTPGLDVLIPALTGAGVSCSAERVSWETLGCDVDGDGTDEALTLIRSIASDDGLENLLELGEDIFYALLLTDGDQTSLAALERADYTDSPVAWFSPGQPIAADLDGDGTCEIILQYRGWEWGHYSVYQKGDNGWAEVLRSEYGT